MEVWVLFVFSLYVLIWLVVINEGDLLYLIYFFEGWLYIRIVFSIVNIMINKINN